MWLLPKKADLFILTYAAPATCSVFEVESDEALGEADVSETVEWFAVPVKVVMACISNKCHKRYTGTGNQSIACFYIDV